MYVTKTYVLRLSNIWTLLYVAHILSKFCRPPSLPPSYTIIFCTERACSHPLTTLSNGGTISHRTGSTADVNTGQSLRDLMSKTVKLVAYRTRIVFFPCQLLEVFGLWVQVYSDDGWIDENIIKALRYIETS